MALMKVDRSSIFSTISNVWEYFFGRDTTDLPSWRIGFSVPEVNVEEHADKFWCV